MALITSAAILVTAAAISMLVLAASQPSAAAPPSPAIGQPNCTTVCGDVSVPYPFGIGPPHCYWPGFNLTCDTSGRLLLGDGTLRVTVILSNATVQVVRTGGSALINSTDMLTSAGGGFAGGPYMLTQP
ncbi:hypothetical protein ACP70R_044653 [Stipagrostis hirtigluma subsp. patula]